MSKRAGRTFVCAAAVWCGLTIPAAAGDRVWTGFYIGPNVGAAWTDFDKRLSTPGSLSMPYFFVDDAAAISATGSKSWGETELSIGGQAGYNLQLGQIVVGAEIDVARLGFKESVADSVAMPPGGGGAGVMTMATRVDASNLMTLRARIGFASGSSLFYVTGGLAYSKVSFRQATSFSNVPTDDQASETSHQFGWSIGAGGEFALDRNWTLKAEYLYADLGSFGTRTHPATPYTPSTDTVPFKHSVDLTAQVARLGLNYRF